MKELEQTLQRVRLVSPSGVSYRPRARVLSVLKVLAAAHFSQDPWQGCRLAVSELARRCGLKRRIVEMALREAASAGLLRRDCPEGQAGARATFITTLSRLLIEASEAGSKPWAGPVLLFKTLEEPPGVQGGDVESRRARGLAQQVARKAVRRAKQGYGGVIVHAHAREWRERQELANIANKRGLHAQKHSAQ